MTQSYALEELQRETTFGGAGSETKRDVPVIDLSNFEERREQIADELWHAATEIGFFQLKNHGITRSEIDAAF